MPRKLKVCDPEGENLRTRNPFTRRCLYDDSLMYKRIKKTAHRDKSDFKKRVKKERYSKKTQKGIVQYWAYDDMGALVPVYSAAAPKKKALKKKPVKKVRISEPVAQDNVIKLPELLERPPAVAAPKKVPKAKPNEPFLEFESNYLHPKALERFFKSLIYPEVLCRATEYGLYFQKMSADGVCVVIAFTNDNLFTRYFLYGKSGTEFKLNITALLKAMKTFDPKRSIVFKINNKLDKVILTQSLSDLEEVVAIPPMAQDDTFIDMPDLSDRYYSPIGFRNHKDKRFTKYREGNTTSLSSLRDIVNEVKSKADWVILGFDGPKFYIKPEGLPERTISDVDLGSRSKGKHEFKVQTQYLAKLMAATAMVDSLNLYLGEPVRFQKSLTDSRAYVDFYITPMIDD